MLHGVSKNDGRRRSEVGGGGRKVRLGELCNRKRKRLLLLRAAPRRHFCEQRFQQSQVAKGEISLAVERRINHLAAIHVSLVSLAYFFGTHFRVTH